jgi:hypothetical protein
MKTNDEKIKILLIDDRPEGLWKLPERSDNLRYPSVSDLFEDKDLRRSELFDVRWIATAGEAREYRDLTRLIAQRQPSDLAEHGWVPEIIVVDYSLTGSKATVKSRLSRHPDLLGSVSPLPSLQSLAARLGLELPYSQEEFAGTISQDHENFGCFVGGLILTTFAEHPCVPVTVTVRKPADVRGTYAGFFEWLLTADSLGELQAAGRLGIGWKEITNWGAARLRRRIEELARLKLITLSLADLMELAEDGDRPYLALESRYGVRRLPVAGLFCDAAGQNLPQRAGMWAKRLLDILVGAGHAKDLGDAMRLADAVWAGYENRSRMLARLELANLVGRLKAGEAVGEGRLGELWNAFSHSALDTNKLKSPGARISLDKDICELRMGEASDLSRRWAALMIIVKLLKWRCQVARLGETHAEDARISNALRTPLQPHDVYLALFPVSKDPVDLSDVTGKGWVQELKRWNHSSFPPSREPGKCGNLRLDIEDALRGRTWFEDPDDKSVGTYGLREGERQLLMSYAVAQVFPQMEWDDQTRRFLCGSLYA